MGDLRAIAAFLLIGSIFFSWGEFFTSALGVTITVGLTPREIAVGGYGWFDAQEVHSYSEYLLKIRDTNNMDPMEHLIYKVGNHASTILILLIVAIVLVVYAGLAPNRYASLLAGVVGLVTAVLFLSDALTVMWDYTQSYTSILTGVAVKVRGFMGEDVWTFRLSWG